MLDLNLPDIDGIEVCRRIRKSSDVPILMLTARDEDVDKIIGLEVGADDYLTKPFNPRELVARVKSVLRRAAPERGASRARSCNTASSSIDAGRGRSRRRRGDPARAQGVRPALGAARPPRIVLTRDQLLERVWGYTFAGDTRTVDVHVRQMRRKLGDASPIVTVWGVGYKVAPDRAPAPTAAAQAYPGPDVRVAPLPTAGPLPGGYRLVGLVSIPIALRLFQDFTRTSRSHELRREARESPSSTPSRRSGPSTRTRPRRRSRPSNSSSQPATALLRRRALFPGERRV